MADKIVGVYDIKVDQAVKNLNKLEKEVKDVGTQSKKTAKDTEQQYTKLSKNLSGSFKNLGRQLAGAFAIGGSVMLLKNAITGIINTTKDFEFQMSRVKAITGATSKEFNKLSTDAKRLGASTKFTATQVAELQEEFAKLGFSTTEILNATEATLTLAEATGSELAESANVAGAVLRSFGLDAEETQRVVDVMALSFSKSALNMTDFSEAMKFVAPIAKSANIEIETVTALLGKLADSGLRGSIAGTGLKNLLAELSNENSQLAKRIGFSVKNSNDLTKAFEVLATKNIDLTEALALTDKRSAAAFTTLIRGAEDVKILNDELVNATGAAQEMADVMRDNLKGDLDQLSASFERLQLALGEGEGGLARLARLGAKNWTSYAEAATRAALSNDQLIEQKTAEQFAEISKSIDESSLSIDELIKKYGELLVGSIDNYQALVDQGRVTDEVNETWLSSINALQQVVNMLREKRDAQKEDNEETENAVVVTDLYVNSINQLNKELKDYQKELKDAEIGSTEFFNIVDKINKKTRELNDAIAMTKLADALKVDVEVDEDGEDRFIANQLEFLDQNFPDAVERATTYASDQWDEYFNSVMEGQDEMTEHNKASFFDYANATGDLFANLSQIQRNLNEEELNNLAAQLERGQITREEYDAKRKEIMREQAESDKALAIFDATVNGASAIVNALNTDPTGVLAAIVGASVAAQIAAIASQPLPQFAEGGFINEHGEFVGRKHSQGGVKIEAEGGEFITAAKYAQPNKDILKAINSGSWEKYKVENIIAPAIEQVLEGGLQGLGASYSLQNNFNDRNLLKAIDRHRNSDKDGFMYLAKELKRMNPRKRGGFA
jgi:TP901 family phage tail tape measure protein